MPDLYFCAGDNKRMAEIAIRAGLRYGARLPSKLHYPIEFADQNWKKPDVDRYIQAVEQHRPNICTVLDWERYDQLETVLDWADRATQTVNTVIIIPKVWGAIAFIPEHINGKEVRLGIPCGPQQQTAPPLWEFGSRPVHVLGGQPHKQMQLAHYLNVVSVDCSVTAYMARRKCAFWTPTKQLGASTRHWAQLQEVGLGDYGKDAMYEAFTRSCDNVLIGWDMFNRGLL